VDKSQTEVAEGESDDWDQGTPAQSRVQRIVVESPHQNQCPFAHAIVKIDRDTRHVVVQSAMHSLCIFPSYRLCGSRIAHKEMHKYSSTIFLIPFIL
jgi:hypothetical protein